MHAADLGLRLPAWPSPCPLPHHPVTPNPRHVSRKALLGLNPHDSSLSWTLHTSPTQPPDMCGRSSLHNFQKHSLLEPSDVRF